MTAGGPGQSGVLPHGALLEAWDPRTESADSSRVVVSCRVPAGDAQGSDDPVAGWHAAASVLVETTGSMLAALARPDALAVGVDLTITFTGAPQDAGARVRASAVALAVASDRVTSDVTVTADDGRPLASGRLTCAVLRGDGRPLPGDGGH